MLKKAIFILSFLFFILPTEAQISELASRVMEELNISLNDYNEEFIVEKIIPNSKGESIIVIPELADFEDEYFFSFNTHILIVDNKTGEIKSQYFESHETNDWYSDAVKMMRITIDTAPYYLQEGKRAFGIRVYYVGSSRVNPYNYESLSLFIPNEKTMDVVLKNYTMYNFGGEMDGDCESEFKEEKKILIIQPKKTNGYFDIKIVNTILITRTTPVDEDDCAETEESNKQTSILKYKDGVYQ